MGYRLARHVGERAASSTAHPDSRLSTTTTARGRCGRVARPPFQPRKRAPVGTPPANAMAPRWINQASSLSLSAPRPHRTPP